MFRSRRGWIERECRLPEALAGAIAGLAAEGSDGWRHRRIAMEANERESLSETVCGRRWSALLRRVASCA